MPGNPLFFYQTLGALHIISSSRIVKCFHREAMVFIPCTGTDMQGGHLALRIYWRGGDALVEAQPEQIRKEVVIAVPAPLVVQGDEEQIGAFEVFQGGLPARCGVENHYITQGSRHPVEDGGV